VWLLHPSSCKRNSSSPAQTLKTRLVPLDQFREGNPELTSAGFAITRNQSRFELHRAKYSSPSVSFFSLLVELLFQFSSNGRNFFGNHIWKKAPKRSQISKTASTSKVKRESAFIMFEIWESYLRPELSFKEPIDYLFNYSRVLFSFFNNQTRCRPNIFSNFSKNFTTFPKSDKVIILTFLCDNTRWL